jgi:hypothetical protein
VFAYIDGILSTCCLLAKNLDFFKTEELRGFIQIYATPMYEFMDTHFARKDQGDWSAHSMLVRLITRGTYITISTFLGALLPFFGDFITLTGAMAAFPLESGIPKQHFKVSHYVQLPSSTIVQLIFLIAGINKLQSDERTCHGSRWPCL